MRAARKHGVTVTPRACNHAPLQDLSGSRQQRNQARKSKECGDPLVERRLKPSSRHRERWRSDFRSGIETKVGPAHHALSGELNWRDAGHPADDWKGNGCLLFSAGGTSCKQATKAVDPLLRSACGSIGRLVVSAGSAAPHRILDCCRTEPSIRRLLKLSRQSVSRALASAAIALNWLTRHSRTVPPPGPTSICVRAEAIYSPNDRQLKRDDQFPPENTDLSGFGRTSGNHRARLQG